MLVLDHGELVDREPVVAVRVVEIEYANLSAADPAFRVDVLHRHARDEHPMEVAVSGLQRRSGRVRQSADGVFERIVGNVGIEPGERGPQAAVQDDLAVVGAFCSRCVGCDVRAVEDGPAERCQPVEGDGFDRRFRQGCPARTNGSVRLHALRPRQSDLRARLPFAASSPAAHRRPASGAARRVAQSGCRLVP